MNNERLYMELEEICNYNYEEMQSTLDSLQFMLNQAKDYAEEHTRVSSECQCVMTNGYITSDFYYYCSDECLHKHYTEEEWKELHEKYEDDFYWTSWEE